MGRTEFLESLVERLNDALHESANGEYWGEDKVVASIECCGCTITAIVNSRKRLVEIYDDNDQVRYFNNIEEYLEKKINSLGDIEIEPEENEWTLHGFRDEADYLRYRYG